MVREYGHSCGLVICIILLVQSTCTASNLWFYALIEKKNCHSKINMGELRMWFQIPWLGVLVQKDWSFSLSVSCLLVPALIYTFQSFQQDRSADWVARSELSAVFVNKVWLKDTLLICLRIVNGCFWDRSPELSSWDRDRLAHET